MLIVLRICFTGDESDIVATRSVLAAQALGAALPPSCWVAVACETASAPGASLTQRTAPLIILSALLFGAGESLHVAWPEHHGALPHDLWRIASCLKAQCHHGSTRG